MSRYVAQTDLQEFIVGTEDNFVYRLQMDNPDKIFYPVGTSCTGMNQINLAKVKLALEQMKYKVYLPDEIRSRAKHALDKMLRIR
jgi:quinolinate synthase